MLTKENFQTMVGYTEVSGLGPMACGYLLEHRIHHWTTNISDMDNDDIITYLLNENLAPNYLRLDLVGYHVICDKTFDEILLQAWEQLQTFAIYPVYSGNLDDPFAINSTRNRIAFLSRRGVGNARLGNIVVYRGESSHDCCLNIIKCNEKYGMIVQPYFERYGLKISNG